MIGPFKGEYRWLSNFWPSPVRLDARTYPTVEHAYQAAKTSSTVRRRQIRDLPSPGEAKRAGAALELPPDWKEQRTAVMRDLLRQKFDHPDLAELLLGTGDEELVEINTWGDTFWGVCDGVGENRLGLLLQEIRSELRAAGACDGR